MSPSVAPARRSGSIAPAIRPLRLSKGRRTAAPGGLDNQRQAGRAHLATRGAEGLAGGSWNRGGSPEATRGWSTKRFSGPGRRFPTGRSAGHCQGAEAAARGLHENLRVAYLWLRRIPTLSQPFFERSDPDLNHLTPLGHRVCAIVRGTTQFDSKLAAFPDALHQSVDEIVQGSDMLRLIQINIALVPQIDLHGRLIAGSSFNHQELCHRGRY